MRRPACVASPIGGTGGNTNARRKAASARHAAAGGSVCGSRGSRRRRPRATGGSGPLVDRHRATKTAGAAQRHRLSFPHLRCQLPDRAVCHAEAARGLGRRSPRAAAKAGHHTQRAHPAIHLRHRQPRVSRHPAKARQRPDADGRGGEYIGHRHRTAADARCRRARHPLQSLAGRRHQPGHGGAAVAACERTGLALPDQHAGRADLLRRRSSCASRASWYSTTWRTYPSRRVRTAQCSR